MATKVLVFESDSAFANELVSEFQSLGCELQVVDDGNVGLQMAASDRPDLILLSIELPRMNGFSVCNKLKKDPALKDIPLIIMSSESSEETFEQHKRLRTRAEDYIHKPIAFADLLERLQTFVPLSPASGPESLEDAIIIDDDIAFEENDDDDLHTVMMDRPSLDAIQATPKKEPIATPVKAAPRPANKTTEKKVDVDDLDVDAFADDAFDRLLDGSQPPPPAEASARVEVPPTQVPPQLAPDTSDTNRPPTIPAAQDVDPEEINHLRAEVERYRNEVVKLEQDLTSARTEARKHENDAKAAASAVADVERLQRQVEELKSRAASGGARTSGISSREFLDLREALNKKDKEILGLRDQMSHKEKDLLDARDVSLALEREKADTQDKLLEFEKQVLDLQMAKDRLTVEKEEALNSAADLDSKLRLKSQELTDKLAEAERARESALAEQKATLDAERAKAVGQAEQSKNSLKADLEGKLAALRSEKEALDSTVADLRNQVSEREGRIGQLESSVAELQGQVSERDNKIGQLESKVAELEGQVSERDGKIRQLEGQVSERDGRIGELEGNVSDRDGRIRDLEGQVSERDGRIGELEGNVSDRDGRIRDLEGQVSARDVRIGELEGNVSDRDGRIRDLEGQVSDRDGRIGELEGRVAERDNKISELESRVQGLESQVSDRDGRIGSLESDKRDLDARVRELEGNVSDRDGKIGELENSVRDRDGRIAGLESELGDVRGKLAETESAKKQGDGRIRDLESSLAKMITDRDALTDAKQELTGKVADLEGRLGALREKLEATEASLNAEVDRSRKNQAKWDQDRASLDRAKNALAAVLMQIEEVETRVVE